MKTTHQKYGWVRDLPDHRDLMLAPHVDASTLPTSVDLEPQCPPVVNQGDLGSCTGNSIAGAHYFNQLKENKTTAFQPSRLFIYYNERSMEGTVRTDSGAQIRDGIKSIATSGVCPESMWPYNIGQFTVKPNSQAYTEALKHKAITYARVPQTVNDLKACLASGFPFVYGFTVYESFESAAAAQTGIIPMPGANESVLGGHAVYCIGYDDATQRFKTRNSWSTAWGAKGDFFIPYAYLTNTNLSSDFWKISFVQD